MARVDSTWSDQREQEPAFIENRTEHILETFICFSLLIFIIIYPLRASRQQGVHPVSKLKTSESNNNHQLISCNIVVVDQVLVLVDL
jgi:hypothetical protein